MRGRGRGGGSRVVRGGGGAVPGGRGSGRGEGGPPPGSRLRPLGAPEPAGVRVGEDGLPLAVRAGRRWRRVEAVREAWRIDDEWWRRPLSREYVTLVLEDGRALTLYRDRVEGGWWMQP